MKEFLGYPIDWSQKPPFAPTQQQRKGVRAQELLLVKPKIRRLPLDKDEDLEADITLQLNRYWTRLALRVGAHNLEVMQDQIMGHHDETANIFPPVHKRLKREWEGFVDNLMKE
ncbi:hypothetical protein P691DRAFT_773343 [Macrolepiota fuliginosa MF-IS2]|uniref:Uncharacterized protein n=1 Tax=Macrolepiota fuliginosa MF-IS2 TaxID=1400762 RepID=A0A9P5XGT1_9AGAR|nr:hypothetical protein P691DRAFT_773343 [Macrolepiota fuliginosa MF-IS2]